MKYKLIIILILLLSLTGCNNKDYKLRIKESSWSGWDENYKPDEITKDYEIVEGKTYVINEDKFSFTITKINKDSIEIRTNQNFSISDDGSVDLYSKQRDFVIYKNTTIVLTTPTMDFGFIYYLSLVK